MLLKSIPTRRRVIHTESLPLSFPLTQAAVVYLLLERFHAPAWLSYSALFVYVLGAIFVVIDNWTAVKENVPGFGRTWGSWE